MRESTSVALLNKVIINRAKLNKLNKQSNLHMQICGLHNVANLIITKILMMNSNVLSSSVQTSVWKVTSSYFDRTSYTLFWIQVLVVSLNLFNIWLVPSDWQYSSPFKFLIMHHLRLSFRFCPRLYNLLEYSMVYRAICITTLFLGWWITIWNLLHIPSNQIST